MGTVTHLLARPEEKLVLETIQTIPDHFGFIFDLWNQRGEFSRQADSYVSDIASHLKYCHDTMDLDIPMEALVPMVLLNAGATREADMLTMHRDEWMEMAQWVKNHSVNVEVDIDSIDDVEAEIDEIVKSIDAQFSLNSDSDDESWEDF